MVRFAQLEHYPPPRDRWLFVVADRFEGALSFPYTRPDDAPGYVACDDQGGVGFISANAWWLDEGESSEEGVG